jgi:hypothetical protein
VCKTSTGYTALVQINGLKLGYKREESVVVLLLLLLLQ